MQIACDEAKRHVLVGSTLDLARTEDSSRIAVQQQTQQDFRGICCPSSLSITGIQRREVQLGHRVYDEAGQMISWQTIRLRGWSAPAFAHSLPF